MLPFFITGLIGLSVAKLTSASPTPINPHLLLPLNEVAVRDPLDVARDPTIEKRISADFSLNHEWHNEVLFEGGWSGNGEHGSESVDLSVVCRECWTKGDVTARLTTRDIIKPVVRLELGNVEAYVDLAVDVSARAVYAINLFTSNSPVGIGLPGLSVGLVFYVDLVFSASAVLDLDGGFYVTLEDDAFLEADVFGGDITDSLFDGIGTKTFPITVRTGKATFKAALRLRVQLGVETHIPLIGISLGGGAVAGIYANIIEFVAEIETYEKCALETRQWFNLNVGAYARAGFDVDFTSIGVAPTVSTTLFDSPTWTQCWIESQPANSVIAGGNAIPSSSRGSTATGGLAEFPSLPAFGGKPVIIETSYATTGSDAASLVVATPLYTPPDSSLINQPPATATPSAEIAVPKGNSSIITPGQPELVTTVIYPTTEYSLTRCGVNVMNCPGSMESKIIVTKTLDAYTTVCPPGARVTVPPRPINKEPPVIHIVTEVVTLHKLQTPIVNTYHGTPSEQPTADRLTVAEAVSASSSVAIPTPDNIVSITPVVSEFPAAVQEEAHMSHSAIMLHEPESSQTTAPESPDVVPIAASSKFQASCSLHLAISLLVAMYVV